MTGPKITIVGGGSYSWGPLFVRDLLIAPALLDARIVLHDVDQHALDTVETLGAEMVQRRGHGSVEGTLDLDDALRGADFVILTITTGGLEAMRHDLEIPEKYGVFQAVGDTVGPGGLARALRNIPVVAALAQKMEQLCPRAWLLNYTNPMTTLSRSVTKTSVIRTIGLCHEWHGVRRRLAAYFDVPEAAFAPRIAGINHLIWLLGLEVAGEDYMPRMQKLAADILAARGQVAGLIEDDARSTIDRGMVKSRLLQIYGALPVAGDRHVAEFFPFFLSDAASRGRAWGIDRTPIAERYTWRDEAWQALDRLGKDEAALAAFLARSSGEVAGEIITALATGERYDGIMNLPNRGQIANLPGDAVVETLGVIENGEARGLPVGEVPPAIQSILQRHITNQELTVEAALTGSRELALQALLGDSLCPPDVGAAERMLEEMLAANQSHLQLFFETRKMAHFGLLTMHGVRIFVAALPAMAPHVCVTNLGRRRDLGRIRDPQPVRPRFAGGRTVQWRLYLFGPPRLERDGKPVEVNLRKGLALLAFSSLTRRPHSRDVLATLFWPDKNQQIARANLRRLLYDLGQLLGNSFFDVTTDRVTIHAATSLWLDVEQYQHCQAELLPPRHSSTSPVLEQEPEPYATRLAQLTEAAGIYAADFMAGFTLADCPEFDDWQFFQREELRRSFAILLEQLVSLFEERGRWEEALHFARRWLALDALEEEVHRRLMQLYAYAGQPGAALRQYEECVRILALELDSPPTGETTALYTSIRTKRFPAPDQRQRQQVEARAVTARPTTVSDPPPPIPAPVSTFPKYTTPFVGRLQELGELLRRVRDPDCRLLTIVGPGGMGKTRLAIEAAQMLLDPGPSTPAEPPQFRDGIYFVPLQPVSTHDRLVPVIADVLGLQFYDGEPPQQQLIHYLQDKELLLVLDNFEHLLEGADLVAQTLAAAPGVKLLLTSREALKLHEEWFHPIAGMRLPPSTDRRHTHGSFAAPAAGDADGAGAASALFASSDAAQLFIQAARRAQVTFDPQAEQEEITRICRLLDGIPLALELAASWLKVLSCSAIAEEIDRGMDILVTRHQNVAVRHRSMRVILDQSWQLLAEEAQRALRRLSVFQGGFLQDAAAVIGADLMVLAELVDVAWIYRAPDGRYQMHELLRQYAAGKLSEAPVEEAATQDRHMTFYLRQVGQLEEALTGPGQRTALDKVAGEIDNIQVAWTRAVSSRNASLIGMTLHAMYLFFHMRSRYTEGKLVFSYALHHFAPMAEDDALKQSTQLYYQLQARLGAFHLHQGELDTAYACFSAVVGGSTKQSELAFAYAKLGELARQQGNRAEAEAALHESLTLARLDGNRNLMAEALLGLAEISGISADFTRGEQMAREALVLCRQLQRPDLTAHVLAAVAWPVSCLGRYDEAEQYYRESLTISEMIATPFGIAMATGFLGWMAYCKRGARLTEAAALHARALATYRRIGYRHFIAMGLGDSALVAYEQAAYAQAKHFAQEGLALAEDIKASFLISYNLNVLGAVACDLGELASSRRYLLRSLQITYQLHIPDMVAFTILFVAKLFIQDSKLGTPSAAQQTERELQALELLAFIIEHRATWQVVRDRAQRVQADLMARLPGDAAATALQRGRQQTFDEIASALLREDQG